jgi:hypothetical protein
MIYGYFVMKGEHSPLICRIDFDCLSLAVFVVDAICYDVLINIISSQCPETSSINSPPQSTSPSLTVNKPLSPKPPTSRPAFVIVAIQTIG